MEFLRGLEILKSILTVMVEGFYQ